MFEYENVPVLNSAGRDSIRSAHSRRFCTSVPEALSSLPDQASSRFMPEVCERKCRSVTLR